MISSMSAEICEQCPVLLRSTKWEVHVLNENVPEIENLWCPF
jgi:hypothetical protein